MMGRGGASSVMVSRSGTRLSGVGYRDIAARSAVGGAGSGMSLSELEVGLGGAG